MDDWLGLKDTGLEWYQMALRAVIAYFAILLLIRFGNKRFLGRITSHDIIVAILLGSIVSRGVTGAAPLFTTLFTALVLIFLHGFLSYISLKYDFLGKWIKGKRKHLVKDGKLNKDAMLESKISEEDIMIAAREVGITEMKEIKDAFFERNGEITVIKN